MTAGEIPQRELRNDVARILREVAGGARFRVTVHGKPVAEIGPVAVRRSWAPGGTAERIRRTAGLDAGFAADVNAVLGDSIESI